MDRLLLTAEHLAQLGGVTPRTVWRDVRRGLLPPPIDTFAAAHWHAADAERWLAARQGRAPDERLVARLLGRPDYRPPPTEVTVEELVAMTDISERGIWRLVARGEFPRPLPKPQRPRLWRVADVIAWAKEREAKASQEAGKA